MFFRNEEIVGLDIGSAYFKLFIFRRKLGKKEVSFDITPLFSESPSQISQIIKEKFNKLNVSPSAKINLSISGPEVLFKYIYIPTMKKNEILNVIKLEWDKYISFKLEEVCWDIQILEEKKSSPRGKKEMFVLLVAAKKEIIDKKIQLLKEVGFYPQSINVDSLCLANAFKFFYPSKVRNSTIALFNIGNMYSNLIILKNGIPYFSRDVPLGGRDVTQRILERKRLRFEEAEEFKKNFDGSDQEILYIVKRFIGNISNELALSFEYLKRETGAQVEKVYLSGGGAYLYKMKDFLNENLEVKAELWDFSAQIPKFISLTPEIKRHFLNLPVSIGLTINNLK